MIVKILTIAPWIAQNRKFKMGDKLEVKGTGVSKEKMGKKYVLLDDNDNKTIAFYEDEYQIIKP